MFKLLQSPDLPVFMCVSKYFSKGLRISKVIFLKILITSRVHFKYQGFLPPPSCSGSTPVSIRYIRGSGWRFSEFSARNVFLFLLYQYRIPSRRFVIAECTQKKLNVSNNILATVRSNIQRFCYQNKSIN